VTSNHRTIKLVVPDDRDFLNEIGPAAPKLMGYSPAPPQVLLLKRRSIRQYPNGQGVALYFSDALNKFIAIPYGPDTINVTTEEFCNEGATIKHGQLFRGMTDQEYENAVRQHLTLAMDNPAYKGVDFDDADRAKMRKLRDKNMHPRHMFDKGTK
jgi:flagellum-specific peptidoglycan hydrolase FlgJ